MNPPIPARFRSIQLSVGTLVASVLPAIAQLPTVSVEETPKEIHVAADFTGNGLLDTAIVDRTSGAFRLGRQVAAGSFIWDEPRATGVGNVTSATAGLFLSTSRHALAVTAPAANRVSFIDPTSTDGPVQSDASSALGPLSLTSGQIFGSTSLEDLLLTSSLNSGPHVHRFARFVNEPAASLTQSGGATQGTDRYDSTRRVTLKTSLSSTVAFMQRSAVSSTFRVVSLNESGSPVRLAVTSLPADADYVLAPFAGATHATLITYVSGDSSFTRRGIAENTPNVYTASSPTVVALPFPVGAISAIKGGGGVRLAVLSEDRLQLAVYDFDGTNMGSLVQTLAAPSPAQPFAGIVPLGNTDGFVTLHAGGPDRGTVGAEIHSWNAGLGEFTAGAFASFPEIAPRAGAGNVTMLTAEPFVDPAARPVSLRNARDWTSGTPPTLPGPVDVTAEIFLSEPLGLGNPLPVNLGSSPGGATHALLNQYGRGISIFTLSRAGGAQIGQVGISPAPGIFPRAIELRFNSLPDTLTIFFRDAEGPWQTYTEPGPQPALDDPGYAAWFSDFAPLVRYKETLIEYYGQDAMGRRTPIRTAHYRFSAPPDSLSSIGDEVPDYVKLGLGINPFELPQGDPAAGVANSLQQVLQGSGIDPRWLAGSAIDLYVRPHSHDGISSETTPSRLATNPPEILPDGTAYAGNQITLYSLSGSLLARGTDPIPATDTLNEGLGVYDPPFAEPSALITGLGGADNTVFIAATRPNFALAGLLPPASESSSRGRQLIGLLPLSPPPFGTYTRTYTGGTDAAEAAAWIAGATSFYAAQPPPVVTETIDSIDVLSALVFERWLLLRFLERELLPASFTPPVANASSPPPVNPDLLTLSAFRTGETALPMGAAADGALTPSEEALRAIGQWDPDHDAYSLADAASAIRTTVTTSADPDVAALRDVTIDLFRISAAHGNTFPGAFDPPIDVLRRFLATGEIPEPYTAAFTSFIGAPFSSLAPTVYMDALDGLAIALAAPSPRPNALLTVEIRSDSLNYPGCLVVNEVSPPLLRSLFNRDGRAFRLPANFNLLPGTRLEIRAFTDAPFTACVGTALEVIEINGQPTAEVTLLPAASGDDTDGNLLGDEWELAFFGDSGVDPWDDINGDGYTNLQKYLDGRDPFLVPSYTDVAAADLQLPDLSIENLMPGVVLISFEFPQPYASQLNFQVFENPTLSGGWSPAALTIDEPAPGQFEVVVPYDPDTRGFWRIGLSLP